MTDPNDQAFPSGDLVHPEGLTKREYLASIVAGGLCAHPTDWSAEQIAKYALEQADALIFELNKEPKC